MFESLKVGTVTTRSEADIVRVHWKYQTHDMHGCICCIDFMSDLLLEAASLETDEQKVKIKC